MANKKINIEEEDDVVLDSNIKIDNIKKMYTLKNKYYSIIETKMQSIEKTLLRHISRYRDNNISILSSPYPLSYPLWKADDNNIIFNLLGIDEDEFMSDILKVKLPADVPIKKNFTPFPTLMILIMKYYIENLDNVKLNILFYYMAYSMYWSIFSKYFPSYKPREETMTYTINNLSNKFILKKLGSIDGLLYYSVSNTIEAYRKRVKRASDAELYYIIDALKTRLNNYFNKIKNEYEKNDKEKNVIFKSDEIDDASVIRDNTSVSGTVESLSIAYTNKFFASYVNQNIINKASKLTSVSASELKTTLNILLSDQRIDQVKKFYASLFYVFFSEPGVTEKTVQSMKFLGVMGKIYKKSNTTDKNIIAIKELMNEWLTEGSKSYRVSNREGTLNNYRKAIYYYFIFSIVM